MLKAKFRLIRYADDYLVMCKTEKEAEAAYKLSKEILEHDLGLALHERDDEDPNARTRIVKPTQTTIQFLGVHFNGSRLWPAHDKRLELSNKLRNIQLHPSNVLKLLTSTKNLIEGWTAAYGFTDINPKYATTIDQEVNKHLWKTLSKLQWYLRPKHLSPAQRNNSGIQTVSWYLEGVRNRLQDYDLFSKYWSE